VKCLETISKNKNKDRILAIVGGGKMNDKLELLVNLSKKVDGIYIAGGNVNAIYFDSTYDHCKSHTSTACKLVESRYVWHLSPTSMH
jgi:3-phosphoglycerate kinase